MNGITELKAIDFFCGAGGMTYGLTLSGIKVLAGIDNNEECKETYEINNPNSKFIPDDIKELSVNKLQKLTDIRRNDDFLIFVGCSPCQYWTQINTSKSKSSETKDLLKDFHKFISYFLPGQIIVENVKGILDNQGESGLLNLLRFLEIYKYTYDYKIINALDYGVPQNRKRFLLVASRTTKEIRLPYPQSQEKLRVIDFIGVDNGFPKIGPGHNDNTDFLHTTADLTEKNIKRLEKTPSNGGLRSAWKDDPELQIDAYKGKDKTFQDTYGRMRWDKPAPTITTKFHSISNGRFAHPEENRGLSLREGATLQTFPKTYIFKGSGIGSIARQIGNAVPQEMARRIGLSIVHNPNKTLDVIKTGNSLSISTIAED
jgi:DNA (cytosine-5)-methyltransferase 1